MLLNLDDDVPVNRLGPSAELPRSLEDPDGHSKSHVILEHQRPKSITGKSKQMSEAFRESDLLRSSKHPANQS